MLLKEATRPLTALLTPLRKPKAAEGEAPGSIASTLILDYRSAPIAKLALAAEEGVSQPLDVLHAAHAMIVEQVRAVYALDERQPASKTLTKGEGSCSQRLAILEAVARRIGVPTRVRGLVVDRSFWQPRFPNLYPLLPHQMRLAWPEFLIDGEWRGSSELFGSIGCNGGGAFANSGSETLFEAVGRCAVDWDGKARDSQYDLSRYVVADLGTYNSRDQLFDSIGETLNPLAKALLNPPLSRVHA
jgi:hypothetical protein